MIKPAAPPKPAPIAPTAPKSNFKTAFKDIQEKEETDRKEFLERVAAKAQNQDVSLIPKKPALAPKEISGGAMATPLVKKPSRFKKILVRLALVVFTLIVLAGLGTFWYWYLVVRDEPAAVPETQQPAAQELIIPDSLIPIQETKMVEFSNPAEISSQLSSILAEQTETKQITRIIIKNKLSNELLGAKDFFSTLGILIPAGLLEKIENNFTLFSYNQRLGFVIKTKEDLSSQALAWEPSMEADFNGLLLLAGGTGSAQDPAFKSASYQETAFRYLSLPQENLGICWAAFDNYFVFTSSGESMIKIIEEIK
jgi:hypothetical protein